LTEGYFDPDLTPERLAQNFAQVCDETSYTVPTTIADELIQVISQIKRASHS
jgi:hypothetical protein